MTEQVYLQLESYEHRTFNGIVPSLVRNHDIVVEIAIGCNEAVVETFRRHGFTGPYVGINNQLVGFYSGYDGLDVQIILGDGLDADLMQKVVDGYKRPLLVTNNSLYLIWNDNDENLKKLLELGIKDQVHRHPLGFATLIYARVNGDLSQLREGEVLKVPSSLKRKYRYVQKIQDDIFVAHHSDDSSNKGEMIRQLLQLAKEAEIEYSLACRDVLHLHPR